MIGLVVQWRTDSLPCGHKRLMIQESRIEYFQGTSTIVEEEEFLLLWICGFLHWYPTSTKGHAILLREVPVTQRSFLYLLYSPPTRRYH